MNRRPGSASSSLTALLLFGVMAFGAPGCGTETLAGGSETDEQDAGEGTTGDTAALADGTSAALDTVDTSGPEDTASRLKEIGNAVKANGLFSQITGVGGNPNTVFHSCWNQGTTTYLAGTDGTVIGNDGLSWKTLTEGTFPTLNGISSSTKGTRSFAVGMQGVAIQATAKAGELGTTWGPPGGCKSSADCDDKDPCSADYCDTGVCQHVASKATGCCGSVPLSDAFDNLGHWTVTDIYAGQAKKGGVVWAAASNVGITGDKRWTSPQKALYFGISGEPCKADPSKTCPTYDNGQVTGSAATSEPLVLPKAEKLTLTFQLLMDVRDGYYDDLRVYVLEAGQGKKTIWYKQQNNAYKGSTGGKFVLQTLDLTAWSGKTIQLEVTFDAKIYSATTMGGEGVYIDDMLLSTTCAAGEVGSQGLSDATFFDVWAANDDNAWAVGTSGTIARWDGQDWKLETGTATRDILAFAGVPGVKQLAVGQKGLLAEFGPTGMAAADKPAVTQDLYAIAVTPDNDANKVHAVAVGNAGTVVEYENGAWKMGVFPLPLNLRAVAADGNGNYIAAGSSLVYKRSKTGIWSQAGNAPMSINAAVFAGGAKYLLAGNTGKNAEYSGSAIIAKPDIGSVNLRSLWAFAGNDVWVAGDSATIAQFSGVTWKPASTPFTQHLRGIWGTDSSNMFAVGLLGTIARYDGNTWTTMTAPGGPAVDWLAVWGTDANDVYAAGKGGLLARYNGVAWKIISGPVLGTLRAVWGSSHKDVWAVGSGASIYHSDGGGSWQPVAIEPYQPNPKEDPKDIKEDLYAIWGSGPDDVWATGAPDGHSDATLLHYNGKTWQYVPALGGEGRVFRAIWGWHKGSVLFAGTQGMVYHYNGSEFRELPSDAITTFFGVCSYGKDALLVGGIGTVIRYIPPAGFRTLPTEQGKD